MVRAGASFASSRCEKGREILRHESGGCHSVPRAKLKKASRSVDLSKGGEKPGTWLERERRMQRTVKTRKNLEEKGRCRYRIG